MKSIRTALLVAVAALVVAPAANAQDSGARHGGGQNMSRDPGRGADNGGRPAPPQAQMAQRPVQAPQAMRAPPAPSAPRQAGNQGDRGQQRGNWNGGNRPVDTGAARAQWQANRGQDGRDQGGRNQGDRNNGRPGNAGQPNQDRGQWNRNNGGQQFGAGDPRNGQFGNRGNDRRNDGDRRGGNDPRNGQLGDRGNDHRNDGDRRGGNDNRGGDRRWNNANNNHQWDGNGRNGHRPDTNWRNDRRYDWQGWRNSHRDIFRGRYNAPRGFGYRSVYRGFFLEPLFYGSSYWLADPYQYRLPPIEWPYRWVRYYDDAVLVDTTSGEVVDVIQDFFF